MIDFSNLDINKNLKKISISNLLNMLETPFDSETVAQKTYDKNYNNPESKYYHMSIEQILEAWSAKGAESTHYGSLLDDYIGCILTGTDNDLKLFKMDNGYDHDERLHGLCESFDNFYKLMMKSGDMVFIARECYLYLKVKDPDTGEDMYVYGRFDALFYNKRTKKYILIDWKSSGTIDKVANRWTKKMLGPLFKYPQLNWYRYTMQLHFYKQALLRGKYLPDVTSPDDIIVMIVNLPGKEIPEVNRNYQTHNPAMPYNEDEMKTFYDFAIQKFNLMKQNETEKEAEEVEDFGTDDSVEDIF